MTSRWTGLSDEVELEVIDCHCHAGKGDGLTGPWDTSAPLEKYLVRAKESGISHTIIFPALGLDYAQGNDFVTRLAARNPSRFSPFGFIHPLNDRGRVGDIVARLVKRGIVGLKVHRHDARITREICDVALAHHLPVLYDVGGEVESAELLAQEYPKLNFIIPHLGSFADDWKSQKSLIDIAARYSNVFCDSSGTRRFDLLEELIERAGPTKLLFGSDGPWLHPGVELFKIRQLRLAPSSERLVTGGNLMRLLPTSSSLGTPASTGAIHA
jgi:predicted TIM-barrel fold metal-dependent hydrolase